jgi:hypothetical protein
MITIGFFPPRPSRWCAGFCSPPIAAQSTERVPDARPRDTRDRARSCGVAEGEVDVSIDSLVDVYAKAKST